MLSPALETELAAARANQLSYTLSPENAALLQEKTLVMLVSPVAVGKSYAISRLIQADEEFKPVAVITTREARQDDDPALFRTVPHDDVHVGQILGAIKNGEMVNYTVHPTSGRIYGTFPSDYPGTFNVLPTLSGAVEQLRSAPFKRSVVISLSTDPETWKHRLNLRYPEASEERSKCLKEAVVSLKWMLHPDQSHTIFWADNPDDPEAVVRSIIGIVKYNEKSDRAARENARRMLEIAEELS